MSTKPTLYHWLCLTGAIVAEVAGTVVMKMSHSWAFPYAAQVGIVAMLALVALSYYLLALSTTALPVGVAFACWEGLGLTLITLSSVFVLGEHMSLTRFLALSSAVCGVLLIHRGTASGHEKGKKSPQGKTETLETAGTAGAGISRAPLHRTDEDNRNDGDEAAPHALLATGGK